MTDPEPFRPAGQAAAHVDEPDVRTLAAVCLRRCEEISRLTETDGEITRRYLTPPIAASHQRLSSWAAASGMIVRVDAGGNWVGRRRAADPSARVLMIGSHIDTVPNGGRYDGLLGTLIGLSVAESLASVELPFHVDVLALSEEEGVRFSRPYLGSAAMVNQFDPQWLNLTDERGLTMRQAIVHFGLDPDDIPMAAINPDDVIGFVEPHIEQGPVLMRHDHPVGCVTAIAGQSRLLVRFEGVAGHAGTVPMAYRRDALVAASRWITAVHDQAWASGDLRATVGRIDAHPNVRNVVPGRVELSLDVRDPCDEAREAAVRLLCEHASAIAEMSNIRFSIDDVQSQSASRMDASWTDALKSAMTARGLAPFELMSGAGHDAAIMARAFPSAMLFIRQPIGISHHPDEDVREEDVAAAIGVLIELVHQQARQNWK